MADFNLAVAKVLIHEGGYANSPNDPGGETNFGISKRAYPNLDIKNLTAEKAKEIYQQDYWNPLWAQLSDQRVANVLLDTAVNEGTHVAAKFIQRALPNLTIDGNFGPKSLAAANEAEPITLLCKFTAIRINTYAHCSDWSEAHGSWIDRALDWQ